MKKKETKIDDVIDDESEKMGSSSSVQDVENKVDKIIGTTDDDKKKSTEKGSPDFSFEDEADKAVDKVRKSSYSDEKEPKLHHITEKIHTGMEIKHNPPDKGFLNVKAERAKVKFTDRYGEKHEKDKVIITSKDIESVEHVEITDGIFSIDLRNDSEFWFIRSPVTVPSMIRQAVRTAIDVKKCYEMEKRKLELPWILILALIGGAAIIFIMLWSLLG